MMNKISLLIAPTIFFSSNLFCLNNLPKKNEDFSKLLEEKLKQKSDFEFERFQQDQRLNSGPAADRAKARINAASANLPNMPIAQQDTAHSNR